MSIERNHKSRNPLRAAGSHAGGSFSWHATHAVKPKPKSRHAWPQYGGGFTRLIWDPTKRGPINAAMLASPTGTGGATSKPSPRPPTGSDGGSGAQGTKRT